MLLTNKNAVLYGAGGAIGDAFARAFARDGAKVFLAGDNRPPIVDMTSTPKPKQPKPSPAYNETAPGITSFLFMKGLS